MSWLEDLGARLDEDELAREVERERRARHTPIAVPRGTPPMRLRVRMRTTTGREWWERATLSVRDDELLIDLATMPPGSIAIPLDKLREIIGPA